MIKIIPHPQSIKFSDSEVLNLKSVHINGDLAEEIKNDFFDFLSSVGISEGADSEITLAADEKSDEEEYTVSISGNILITYGSAAGLVYALQTLKQIFFQCRNALPYLEIKDKPTKKIRGFMLDSGRYFFSVNDVKLLLRRMALHKLNVFHFHITEDQGWRIESDKYPLLTEKGSVRKRTNFNFKEHGGFYTKEDIREIVRYAHIFGIKVMPEFDIPGHSRAAIACYPYLSCFNRKLPVADHWGVKHDVLCAGKESTYTFVRNIIDEFCELFPDEFFHIGGDEVPKHRWHICPECQKKMKTLGLKNEDELQCNFMNEIKDYCKSKGKQAFMWSWDLNNCGNLDSDLGFTKCGEMNTYGRPFIDTSTNAYYIDLPYGYISLKDTANHKLLDGNCLGVEATLWTEYVPNIKKADRMTYPRLLPLCEAGWNGKSDYSSIEPMLDYYYAYLKQNGIGYSEIKSANPSKIRGKLQVIWFERRRLAWEGLHNIIDDKKAEKYAEKKF